MNLTSANNTLLKIGVDYFKELQGSQKPSNSSVYTGAAGPDLQEGMIHVEEFSKAAFGSSIFIIIVSPMTIVANSLLLVTFLVDPLKIFRNPTSYFLIGLAIVDLLTALIQEPIYATCFMLMYFQHPSWTKCKSWMKFAAYFSAFPISISASIVFAFTLTQYIVVASPLRYGRMITKKKALLSVVAIYLYHTLFCCLPLMGVPQETKHAIDLFFHRYTVVLVTIMVYIILHYTMKKKMTAGRSLQSEEGRHVQVQRSFVRINVVLLIIMIMFFVPSVLLMTIRFFLDDIFTARYGIRVLVVNLMTDNLLYLKFLFDPIVYAWRMSKYRKSLKSTVYRNKDKESSRSENETKLTDTRDQVGELASTELNKSTITLLSFKNVSTD
ncbi:cannabinoid receptor type 1B-like [Pocillopora verrucosa]|uniref:cannabinoid receptor type 1B-like n=1 Tax=Pocillopora verrucosa TaxID=203993 RepID=UPI00334150A8